MLSVEEYVKRFKLDQENYEFKREEFIASIGKEFLEIVQDYPDKNPKTGQLYYKSFSKIVTFYYDKFWEISSKKVGEPFSQRLWSAFFATQVVPIRKKLFPNLQEKILKKRSNNPDGQDKNYTEGKKAIKKEGNNRPSR